MIGEKMLSTLNEQITKEFASGYLYMQMAGWLESQSLPGLANWMRIQALEESCHATILFNHVCERGGTVDLGAIDKPATDFTSPLDVFERTLKHEQFVTESINACVDVAEAEKDRPANSMLQWFIDEQVEEEANADDLRTKLERVGDGNGLFMLDQQCAARVFTMPSPLASGA